MADALQKGIQVVQQAVQNDTANNYLEAIRLYRMALDHFQTALAVELDPSRKSLIQSKMSEYSDRMKKIQAALTSKQDQPQPQHQPQPTPTPVAPIPTPSVPMSSLPQGPYGAIPTTGYGAPGGQLPTPAYGAGVPSSIPVNPSIPSTPLPTLTTQSSLGQLPSSAFSGVSLPASAFPPSSSVPSLPTQSSLGQINPSYLAQSNPSSSAANPYAAFGSNPSAGGQANSGANPYANFSLPASGGSSAAVNPYANLPTSNSSPSLTQLPGSLGGMSVAGVNPSPLPGAVALPGMHQPTPTPTPAPSVGGGFSVSSAPGVINPAQLLSSGPPKPLHVALTTTAIQHPRSQCSLKAAMYLAEVAQQEDQQRNYQDALDLYTEVLERFLLISENESNPMFKQTYREQMEVYMRRAEQIKTSLQITPNRVVESVLQQASRNPEPSAPLIDLAPSQPPPGRPLSAKPSMGPGPGSFAASSSSDHLLSNPPPPSRRNPLYDNVGPQDNMNFFGNHDEPYDPTPNVGRIIQIANETKSVLARQRLKLAICLQNNLLQPSENIKIHVKVENRSTMVINFLKLTLRRIERTRKFDSKGREVMSVDAIKVHRQEFYQGSMFPLPAEANYTGELLYQVPAGLRPTNMFQRGIFEREYDMCIECDLSMRKNLKVRFEVIIDRPH